MVVIYTDGEIVEVYAELYDKADAEFYKRYKDNDDAMRYYFEVTD